ncbi:MAG: RsmB/NOP family class I SAM-dependent RNA methyltransferase [Nanoarchaeota archaeon]|nr:RsmB/NOP family class I SAM-dependent RNA methyltransferase [Nanoarchaeota archaeon]
MKTQSKIELKPLFVERMKELLGKEFESYLEILEVPPVRSFRCNTLKISPENLKKRLENNGWKISQPWKEHEEVMVVESQLKPGELGNSLEHLLGYYYIQELASMLPVLVLKPEKNQLVLDLCASPGSKTTQMSSFMENTGTIIANEISLGRIRILATNLERCGVSNVIITKKEGSAFCKRLERQNVQFDKILLDAPCSGEGTIRSSQKTPVMWNINTVKILSNMQKNLVSSAISILKKGGELVYSTCTHSPEENEEIVDYVLKNFPNIKIQKILLPIQSKLGIQKWQDKEYLEDVKFSCRVYPHVANTEGFYIAKFKKIK